MEKLRALIQTGTDSVVGGDVPPLSRDYMAGTSAEPGLIGGPTSLHDELSQRGCRRTSEHARLTISPAISESTGRRGCRDRIYSSFQPEGRPS